MVFVGSSPDILVRCLGFFLGGDIMSLNCMDGTRFIRMGLTTLVRIDIVSMLRDATCLYVYGYTTVITHRVACCDVTHQSSSGWL